MKTGLFACVLAGLIVSHSARAEWTTFQYLSKEPGRWIAHERKAGVTGSKEPGSFLLASAHCLDGDEGSLRLSFGTIISQIYRLFFENELVPAIQANQVDLSISIDDAKRFSLKQHSAAIEKKSKLVISGLVITQGDESEVLEALMTGRQVSFELNYEGSLFLTRKFTLLNSSSALEKLPSCHGEPTTVADTHARSDPPYAL